MKGLDMNLPFASGDVDADCLCGQAALEMARGLEGYENNELVSADKILLYTIAALDGEAEAWTSLGGMWEQGDGCVQSYETAAACYLKAAQAGCVWGQRRIGVFYLAGRGIDQDPKWAYFWLNIAARELPNPDVIRERDIAAGGLHPKDVRVVQRQCLIWAPEQAEFERLH